MEIKCLKAGVCVLDMPGYGYRLLWRGNDLSHAHVTKKSGHWWVDTTNEAKANGVFYKMVDEAKFLMNNERGE